MQRIFQDQESRMISVATLVVLYYPNYDHLEKFIKSLQFGSKKIYLIDNTPTIDIQIEKINFIRSLGDIKHIILGDNKGIAYAHNVGLNEFKKSQCDFVLIFDQDSFVDKDFIENLVIDYKKISKIESKIAAIGPAFRDTKTKKISPAIQISGLKVNRVEIVEGDSYTYSDYIISSGTLISKESLEKIGGMLDELFIDYVDVEWGLRAKNIGYKCFISNRVIMTHTIGDASKYIPILKRSVNIHSDFRKYFLLRNPIYLIFHNKDVPLNWKLIQIPKVFLYFFFVLIYVEFSPKMFIILFKALKDGILGKMYKGS